MEVLGLGEKRCPEYLQETHGAETQVALGSPYFISLQLGPRNSAAACQGLALLGLSISLLDLPGPSPMIPETF